MIDVIKYPGFFHGRLPLVTYIDRLHKQFQEEKECNQIFKTKKSMLNGQRDKQNVAVELEDSSEDLEDILDHILSYNVRNMEKVKPSERVKEEIERKAEVIKLMLSDENIQKLPQDIPWNVYMKVLKKAMS